MIKFRSRINLIIDKKTKIGMNTLNTTREPGVLILM